MKTLLRLAIIPCLFVWLQATAQGVEVYGHPKVRTVVQGDSTSFIILFTPIDSFNQQIHITATSIVSSLINVSFSANYLFAPYDLGTVMTVGVTGSVPVGMYWIAINASNGPVVGTDTVWIDVVADLCTWHTPAPPLHYDANSFLQRIVVDSSGNVWTGGWGLRKWDGLNWAYYDQNNSPLPSLVVNDLAMGSGNRVWIAGNNGLSSFDGTYWTVYDSSNSGLTAQHISTIDFAPDGKLWIGTEKGIFTKSGNTFSITNATLALGEIKKLRIDRNGKPYALVSGTGNGIPFFVVFENAAWRAITNLSDIQARDFAIDTAGNLWMVSDNPLKHMGLIKYNGSTIEQWLSGDLPLNHIIKNPSGTIVLQDSSSHLPGTDLHSVYVDSRNLLWATVYSTNPNNSNAGNGVVVFNGNEWLYFNTTNSTLHRNTIFNATERDGRVWLIYGEGGSLGDQSPYKSITSTACTFKQFAPVTAIEEPIANDFVLYPNPLNNMLYVKSSQHISAGTSITVYDLTGRVIAKQVCNFEVGAGEAVSVSLADIAGGIYFVAVAKNRERSVFRVVKE